MRAGLRHWLTGAIVGLFALALVPAPAEHARSVVARTAFALAHAMPDGTWPELCADHGRPADGHGEHLGPAACLACVIMAAPGLPVPCAGEPARVAEAVAAEPAVRTPLAAREVAWPSLRARAPPSGSIA